MSDHPLERPECPCGGEHYYANCPRAEHFGCTGAMVVFETDTTPPIHLWRCDTCGTVER